MASNLLSESVQGAGGWLSSPLVWNAGLLVANTRSQGCPSSGVHLSSWQCSDCRFDTSRGQLRGISPLSPCFDLFYEALTFPTNNV